MALSAHGWSADRSAELYNLDGWGQPYFSIDAGGRLFVRPEGPDGPGTTLTEVIAQAQAEGMSLPLLVRFDGILRHRVKALTGAFATAAADLGFTGRHRPVYPIKVNQQRHVVEVLQNCGRDAGLGLEVGSKPELMAVLALLERPSLMVCNGYKDAAYIEMACLATRLGHEVIVVVEKPSEIETYRRVVQVEGREAAPWLGVRARLAAQGQGRWEGSAGDRAKFGLSAAQIVEAVEWLRQEKLLERLKLLHFHLGSQITAIRAWKGALREASRMYVELHKLGAPLTILDVGGGLAVDYDGSKTRFDSSMNYTEQEYANDVVWTIHDACQKAGIADPDIVTESGRALVAHHAVMAVEVIGVSRLTAESDIAGADPKDESLVNLAHNLKNLSRKNVRESYHDAVTMREEMLTRFSLGLVDLPTRAQCEKTFYATAQAVAKLVAEMPYVPEEFEGLQKLLSDTYFCNFSLFQSVPDHWAIRHVFPVLPVQRLDEEPTVRAVLGDMTCDSDGKIDLFQDLRDVKHVLEVHELREGESYVIGICLVGAYQEILGDLHNLFGDTDTVHVDFDEHGKARLVDKVHGECVAEVLDYVQYDEPWLMRRYQKMLDRLVQDHALTPAEADEVRGDIVACLRSHTYLTASSVRSVRADDLTETEEDGDAAASGPAGRAGDAGQEPGSGRRQATAGR